MYIFFKANAGKQAFEVNHRNNISRAPQPIQLAAPLPDLYATAINVPPVMQPGDTIHAEAKIANYGTTDTAYQAPVVVELVASTDKNFGPGDVVLGTVSISNIPPLSAVPAPQTVLGNSTLDDPINVVTIQFPTVTLPSAPSTYYLGIEIDPNNQIHQISEIGSGQSFALQQVVSVGPPIANLPPAGVVSTPVSALAQFAIPPHGVLTAPYLPINQLPGVLVGLIGDSSSSSTSTSTGSSSSSTVSTANYSSTTTSGPGYALAAPASGRANQLGALRASRLAEIRARRGG